jgi:hypothetical protein
MKEKIAKNAKKYMLNILRHLAIRNWALRRIGRIHVAVTRVLLCGRSLLAGGVR